MVGSGLVEQAAHSKSRRGKAGWGCEIGRKNRSELGRE